MKNKAKYIAGLVALAPFAALAEGTGSDVTPAAVSALFEDAKATITANIPAIAGVLAAAFGIVVAFIVYKLIKKASNKAG